MDFSRTPKSPIRLNHQESRRLVRALTSLSKPPTEAFLRGLKLYRETVISDVNPDSPTYRLKNSPDRSVEN
jgi:hypothetical protein